MFAFPRLMILFGLLIYFGSFNALAQRKINNQDILSQNVSKNLNAYWQNMTLTFENYLKKESFSMLHQWNEIIHRDNLHNKITPKCLNIIEYMIRNPVDREWIAKMIDSGIKLPSGIMSGTTTYLGDFDQCLSIKDRYDDDEFVGKYCLATLSLPRVNQFHHPMPIDSSKLNHSWMGAYIEKWYQNDNFYSMANAVCFPSICNQNEIRQLFLSYYNFLNLLEFNVTYCQSVQEPQEYRFGLIVALTILIIPWVLIIPATILEMYLKKTNYSTIYQILLCFSLFKNNHYLFRIHNSNRSVKQEFQFIHGIRAISALFIMCAHAGGLIFVTIFMPVSVIARHPTDIIKISKTLIAQPFYNGSLVVMTFFIISGFLSTYLNASAQKLKIGFIYYTILRWLRLALPLIGIICMNIVLELLGGGPLFHHDILWPTLRPCYQNWWIHVLFISNFFGFEEMCNISTWYLSADLQLHIIAYLILVLYIRNRRFALIMCFILVGIGMIGVIIPVAADWTQLVLTQTIIYTKFPVRSDVGKFTLFAPFLQFIPYFLGCAVGLIILENRVLKFSKLQETLLWFVSIFIFITLPFSSYPFADDESKIQGDGRILNVANFALMVLLWSLSNSWLVYQCSIKPRMAISNILSANFLKPISRLSFSLYLAHLMTIWFSAHQTRSPISLAHWNEVIKIVSTTIISSFILGYWLHITFEAPVIGLLIFFFKNKKTRKTASISIKNNIEVKNNTNSNNTHNNDNDNSEDGRLSRMLDVDDEICKMRTIRQ